MAKLVKQWYTIINSYERGWKPLNEITQEKKLLRQQLSAVRNQLPPSVGLEQSEQACQHLIELTKALHIRSVLVYIPFRRELDTWPYIEWCWQQHIHVLAPRCDVATHAMILYPLYNKDQLRSGAYGIMEPDILKLKPTDEIPEAVIVPGLAFNSKGQRLGYGGGYYDRLYERLGERTTWIGIAHEQQLVEEIPVDHYDIILNFVVSNKGIETFS